MKKTKKRVLALLAALTMLLSMSIPAFAASVTGSPKADGDIILELSSDKDSYAAGDEIQLTLKVTNNSTKNVVTGINTRVVLPNGVEAVKAMGNVPQVAKNGGQMSVSGTYKGSADVFGSSGAGGNMVLFIVIGVVVAVVVIAVVVLLVLKKKKTKVSAIALLLVAATIVGSLAGSVPQQVSASNDSVALVLKVKIGSTDDVELRVIATPSLTDASVIIDPLTRESVTTASVHDPSIQYTTDENGEKIYYVFGSHRAIASSKDLINWNQAPEDIFGVMENGSVVKTSYSKAFTTNEYTGKVKNSEGVEVDFGSYDGTAWICANGTFDNSNKWQGMTWSLEGNMWAPDVIYNETMGKWCMYYSLNGPKWNSTIVLMTADEMTGPYVYQGPVVFTGFTEDTSKPLSYKNTDIELALGELDALPEKYSNKVKYESQTANGVTADVVTGGSWGDSLPHAIDPCILYDDDGELWMSYGSWSGGIYMLKIDNETGLRDYTYKYEGNELFGDQPTDAYFGVHLAGGAYVTGEASYIEKVGDYYYLWISYGGLETASGYNMRIYRSENIYGPYVDYKGNTGLATSWSDWYNSNRGVRLFGAYKWPSMSQAEVAQGHNSAFVDEDGKAYVIYHTRFVTPGAATQGEGHLVRVHQLVTTKGGWIVAAPFKYMGETVDYDNPDVTAEDLIGDVQIMVHRLNIDYKNYDYAEPVTCTLNADGTISGNGMDGTWELDADGKAYMTITISDGNYKGTYDCVYFKQKVENTTVEAPVFTGIGDNQLTLWGYSIKDFQ